MFNHLEGPALKGRVFSQGPCCPLHCPWAYPTLSAPSSTQVGTAPPHPHVPSDLSMGWKETQSPYVPPRVSGRVFMGRQVPFSHQSNISE